MKKSSEKLRLRLNLLNKYHNYKDNKIKLKKSCISYTVYM